jgi:hypothetical protein
MAGCVSEVQPWVRLLAHTTENRKNWISRRLSVSALKVFAALATD